MAKKRLKIKDKQGNVVDFDISSASVTIDAEGKSLDVKLSELVAAIASAVKSVTFNGQVKNIDANGNVNIGQQMNSNWSESNPNYPSFIQNKPTIPSRTSQLQNDSGYITEDDLPESVECDTQMSSTSTKPVQNKVIKAYVDNLINGLLDGAPAALDTLKELSAALGNNADFAATITQQLSTLQPRLKAGTGISINSSNEISVETGAVAAGEDKPVSGGDVKTALDLKQDLLQFDKAPTANSNNVVKSGGIYTALQNILANITIGQNGHWYIGQTDTNVTAQGPTGNVSISDAEDILIYIINDLTTGGGNNILSAEQGKVLNLMLQALKEKMQEVVEDGFFVADEDGNVGMQYDEDGFDVALLSEHFIELLNNAGIGSSGGNAEVVEVEQDGFFVVDDSYNIAFSVTSEGINATGFGENLDALVGKTYAGECVVRFLPFLSAWNNASKNSLCLCATKQQIVDDKIPFYDGFLFHKLPTDDKSLWYGTTLDNAVQIGTVSFTPKNCLLAMSPTDGRVIATVRGDRGDIHIWDGTTDHTVAAVTSDGNNRKAMGWLYNSGVDFIKDSNNVERCIFAEYDGSVVDKGGFYVWVGTYPYTSASDWKTTLHKPLQYYGTIEDGTITHFHQIRRDPWTNILYLTSGDQPGQLVWWYSTDYGETWTELTNNKTNGWEEHVCRLINFCFTDEWIYWATDHGTNHCLNRIKRNAQTGVIDPSTREKLCDLPFAQACNSICLCESPNGIFMYERIDTGTEYESYYGSKVKMLFWSIPEERLYTVAELGLTNNSWGGSRGKCYLNYTNGQQPRPAMGFSDDTRCYFDIVGADNANIGTIFYEL